MTYQEFLDLQKQITSDYENGTLDPNMERPYVSAEVWCDTSGCRVENDVFLLQLPMAFTNQPFYVFCGQCGSQVHNVQGVFPDGRFPLNTLMLSESDNE